MAHGDQLIWWQGPPVLRKSVRNYVLAAMLASAAAIALVIFRDALGVPREPWGRYGPLFLGLMPIFVFWPMFLLSRKRIARQFKEARGQLCTHCAYNVSTLGERGTCPECGKPFDNHADAETWQHAGYRAN